MPKLQLPKPDHTTQQKREATIKSAVLEGIGTPDDLHIVAVKRLWNDDFYRVNIYRSKKSLHTITDSFFVHYIEETSNRHILECSPALTLKYYDAELGKLFAGEPNALVKLNEAEQELV